MRQFITKDAHPNVFVILDIMKPGVYRHKQHPELLYLFIGLAHHHDTNEEVIVYVPLFTRPEWKGVSRMTYRSVEDFNSTFVWVDERMP